MPAALRPGRNRIRLFLALVLQLPVMAQAHPMEAQHGTLNIVGNGAFLVLSLPVSAFKGVDDDNDGELSMIEFEAHRGRITEAILDGVRLLDDRGRRPLEVMMLGPAVHEPGSSGSAAQLLVMGRYALTRPNAPLRFELRLLGDKPGERTMRIRATHPAAEQRRWLTITPESTVRSLFTSP